MPLPNVLGRIRSAIGNLTRSSLTGTGFVPASPVLSGTFVTPQSAQSLAAVYAAINCISRDIATLPRNVYKRLEGGGREIDSNRELNELIMVSPDGERDAFSYWQTCMSHVLGWGNSYSEIVRNSRGEPVELNVLHPSKTKPMRTDSGRLFYHLDNDRKLPAENVLHFAGYGFDGIQGYSPITVARQTIGLGLAVEQFGASFFGNGMTPKGLIKLMKTLSPRAQANLRDQLNSRHQGPQNAHNVLFLEEGMDWINTQINPNDGQWLETRNFQKKEIATIYSLPPHKLGDYSESHLANVEEANDDYITKTLLGWICGLESQANFKLLSRADRKTHFIAFDLDALERASTAARMSKWQTMRNLGAINADEIRLREGFNPIGVDKGGDLYVIQGQYMPLDQVGKQPSTPPSKRSSLPTKRLVT